jgi:hypothetical protein
MATIAASKRAISVNVELVANLQRLAVTRRAGEAAAVAATNLRLAVP